MTKAQIIYLARNVDLMDKMNTISGLMEINPNDPLINSLVDDIYNDVKNNKLETVTNIMQNKEYMLNEIAKVNPDKAEKLRSRKMIDIRFVYNKLTKGEPI